MTSSQSDLCDLELPGSCNNNHAAVLGRCEDVDPVELVIEDQKQAPLELINDLKAAVEVSFSKSRSVLYPSKSMKLDALPLEVSLRDDPSIHAICQEYDGTQLCLSSDAFGFFCTEVQTFIKEEEVSIQREERLKEQRIRELVKKAKWAAWGPFITLNSCLWGVFLVFLVICLVLRLESYAVAVALGLGAGCLCCCTSQISYASALYFVSKFQGADNVAKDLSGQEVDVEESWLELFTELFFLLFPFCLSVVAFACLVVMTVMYGIHGFPWAATLLWLPVLLLLAFFIALCRFWYEYLALFESIFGDQKKVTERGRS